MNKDAKHFVLYGVKVLYKIFLVEDQNAVRESIRESIPWENTGFVFAGEAPDGEMALPLIEEIKPDILITDIMMPFMDGLELSRIVRKNMPWIKIIILSGHDEFDFAKEAISIGISEYLLKPVGSVELINALKKVVLQIESEKLEKKNLEDMNKRLKDSMKMMKEKFLNDLISGVVPSADAIEKSKLYNMNIISKYYAVGIIMPQIREKCSTGREYEEYLKIESLINNIVGNDEDVIKLSRNLREIFLIFKGDNPEDLERSCLHKSEIIKSKVEENSNCLLSIFIGSIRGRIYGISESFKDADTIKKFNHFFGDNKIIRYNETKPSGSSGIEAVRTGNKSITEFLTHGERSKIEDFVSSYIKNARKEGWTGAHFYHQFIGITMAALKFIEELGGGVDVLFPEQDDLGRMVAEIDTVEKFKCYMDKILHISFDFKENRKTNRYGDVIEKAKEFIMENFSDPEISLNAVASFVRVSPSHFSTIFSQETGETFIEYLTNVRVKKAMELLKTTDLKSSEIALKIGYNDPHYFSHIFKKTTGITIRDFRQKCREG